jgi:hypothetical protein
VDAAAVASEGIVDSRQEASSPQNVFRHLSTEERTVLLGLLERVARP